MLAARLKPRPVKAKQITRKTQHEQKKAEAKQSKTKQNQAKAQRNLLLKQTMSEPDVISPNPSEPDVIIPPNPEADKFYEGAYARIMRNMTVVAVVATLAATIRFGWRVGAG